MTTDSYPGLVPDTITVYLWPYTGYDGMSDVGTRSSKRTFTARITHQQHTDMNIAGIAETFPMKGSDELILARSGAFSLAQRPAQVLR